jgi:hypothetical protein
LCKLLVILLLMETLLNKLYAAKTMFHIVFCCVVLMPLSGLAQFVVKDNTQFFVKGKLSTATQTNQFNSDIQGDEAVLFFVGKDQTVKTAAKASLPNVVVNNANELNISSTLHIKGDLTILKGVLKLNHELVIHGNIKLQNGSFIHNQYLVTNVNDLKHYNKASEIVSDNQNSITAILSDVESAGTLKSSIVEKCKISGKLNFYKSFTLLPVKPPPIAVV